MKLMKGKKIGSVNVIKIQNGKFIGYNSDYLGFKNSLKNGYQIEIFCFNLRVWRKF